MKKNNINYLKYIEQCKFIGFKQNTEKMGECVLRFYEADVKITLLGKEGKDVNSGDVLTNLLILDQSLKLLNPPKKNFKCQARPFGTITNINCQ